MKVLQPTGTYAEHSLSHVGVIDIDGQLEIELPQGKMPIVTFKTDKPIRCVPLGHAQLRTHNNNNRVQYQ